MTNNALHWYVAYVRSCQERKSSEALTRLGVEHYLPIQRVKRQYRDRIKNVEQLVLPRMIFVRTFEARRIKLLSEIYGLAAYMTNGGPYHPVIVPDRQLEDFRMMVEHGEGRVKVSSAHFSPGDKVVIAAGPLKGLSCELISVGDKRCVAIDLGSIGTATLEISPEDLIPDLQ